MANFCSNCGKPLEEGEVCNCTQNPENVQTEVHQEQPAAQEQTPVAQAQKTETSGSQTANQVVEELKEGFLSLLPVIKKPATEGAKLAEKNTIVVGMEFIVIKAIISVLGVLIAFRGMLDYLPVGTLLLVVLLLTIGVDCVEAVLLKAISGAFKVETNTNSMFTIVGIRAAYETIVLIVVAILSLVSASFALVIFAAVSATFTVLQYGIYSVTVKGEADKKIYAYMLVKAIVEIIAILIVYIFAQSLISSLISSLFGFGGFGFGL